MISTAHLRLALAELKRNMALPTSDLAKSRPDLIATFRTAAIKSFEYAYGLSVMAIRRSLEAKSNAPEEVDAMDFKVLMRAAAEAGLIEDPMVCPSSNALGQASVGRSGGSGSIFRSV